MCKHPWPSIADLPDTEENRAYRRKIIEDAILRAKQAVKPIVEREERDSRPTVETLNFMLD